MISIPGYTFIKQIGQGGMASVHLAVQESTQRQVAIKIMDASLAADQSYSDRFQKEARLSYLSHPHIITVYDSGQVDGFNYIVMEYATGGSLDKYIKQGIPSKDVLNVVLQIAKALEYASANDVLHRDVKSENILLKSDSTALLSDFGIAKDKSSDVDLTQVGMTVGSSKYMSPEQSRGLDIDIRSDLYSLGVVFFEALTGSTPFEGGDVFDVALKQINDPIPQLPKEHAVFQPIIDKLLAKDPEDRYQKAADLIVELEAKSRELHKPMVNDVTPKVDEIDKSAPLDFDIYEPEENPTKTLDEEILEPLDTLDSFDLIEDFPESPKKLETIEPEPEQEREPVIEQKIETNNAETFSSPKEKIEPETTVEPASKVESEITRVRTVESEPTKVKPTENTDETKVGPVVYYNDKEPQGVSYFKVFAFVVLIASIAAFFVIEDEKYLPWKKEKEEIHLEQSPTKIELPEPVIPVETGDEPEVKEVDVQETPINEKLIKPEIPIIEAPQEKAEKQEKINQLLAEATVHYEKSRLTSPKNKNAFEFYQEVLKLEPDNKDAKKGIENITQSYLKFAKNRYDNKKMDAALLLANKGLKISPENADLLELKNKIAESQQKVTPDKPIVEDVKSNGDFEKDLSVFEFVGLHAAIDEQEAYKYSKLDLVNKIYNALMKQCNSSSEKLLSDQCARVLKNYLVEWPLPVSFAKYKLKAGPVYNTGYYYTESQYSLEQLQSHLQVLETIIDDTTSDKKAKKLALANLVNYQQIGELAGREMQADVTTLLESTLLAESSTSEKLLSIDQLILSLDDLFDTSNMLVETIYSETSVAFSQYTTQLYRALKRTFPDSSTKENTLQGRFVILNSGDVRLNLWLFDKQNEVIGVEQIMLDKKLFKSASKVETVKTQDLLPQTITSSSFNYPVEIAMSNKTAFELLTIGDTKKLQIKLNEPGYFYIVVHALKENEAYSYLLPLNEGDSKFISELDQDQLLRFVTLGEFAVKPPSSVEVLQIIASSEKLDNYLPKTKWSNKHNNYLILNAGKSIKSNLEMIRSAMNNDEDDIAGKWQEKLLITTILP